MDRPHWIKTLTWGFIAGVLAGIAMLLTMALLRLFLGWPTPTELIFDRIFPLLTVEFFIGSLVRAGGYTPLKLQGVFGALAGQVIVAGLGGVIYAYYLRRRDRRDDAQTKRSSFLDVRGWPLIIPGVLAATILFVVLLWPTLLTNYRGFPPGIAHAIASMEILISFSVCGIGIMFFYGLLSRPPHAVVAGETATALGRPVARRRFVALGIGAALALALGDTLRRLFRMTDANTADRRCRKSRRSDRTTNFIKSQKISLIPTSRGTPGVWTLSGKLKTRVSILSVTSLRCRPSSRKPRCFVFPTE